MKLVELKVGDVVSRLLGGKIAMQLKVSAIDDQFIHCGPWKFDKVTGGEVDEDLGWTANSSGSVITAEAQNG